MNKDKLDELLDEPRDGESSPDPVAPPPKPEAEPDPLAHLIGSSENETDKDPFAEMLDGMLDGEGLSKETETPEYKTDSFEDHEWEFKEELVYEGDKVEAICKKCFRQMKMDRSQTWGEAMEEHGVNPDCSLMLADEVMSS
jgi:hypothetical protein